MVRDHNSSAWITYVPNVVPSCTLLCVNMYQYELLANCANILYKYLLHLYRTIAQMLDDAVLTYVLKNQLIEYEMLYNTNPLSVHDSLAFQ